MREEFDRCLGVLVLRLQRMWAECSPAKPRRRQIALWCAGGSLLASGLDDVRVQGGQNRRTIRELSFFCTSSSDVRIAGDAAATGTEPDSAPQYPLNTSCLSPVATIFVKAASGVPTMSTPRTNFIGRPSA